MKKYWHVYRGIENIGLTGSKHIAFYMLELHAKRPWSKETDTASDDKIVLGEFEARLEGLK